ncbi:glycosyltransferase family 4 protein [Polaribacter sp. 11A2H]|uniref:glycosyltransferase family 4 protein n=1 Tax=Polaribacter sp. 11A2H TaxID=2687290 RepID=UPI00140D5298|nr:glycosyltransferase family 4 protein [Polaribacter sp. 11A2H]
MKILIVNTLYYPNSIGGAEKSVQILAEKLVLSGHVVKVVCLDKQDSNYEIKGVSVNALKIKNNYWPFDNSTKSPYQKFLWHLKDSKNTNYLSEFNKIFIEFKPDVLFTNNLSGFSTNIWSIAKQFKVKIVHTLRDYYLQCPKITKFKNEKNCKTLCVDCKLLSITKKKDSAKVDHVIGISNYILQDHLKNGYFKDVQNQVIYNGFNIKSKHNSINNDKIVFGYIGQVNKSKGVELLLQSFLNIKSKNWQLLIAGNIEEKYLNYLKGINNSDKIKFLGFINSNDFFKKIDVLIVPSLWHEPFGRVVLESLIHKKPVIGSKRGGIIELLSNNKAFIFNPDDENLDLLIEKIILDKNFLNSFNFNEEFLKQFKVEKVVEEYLNVFHKLLINEGKIK